MEGIITKKQLKGNQWNELLKGNTGLGAAYQVTGIPHYVMISPDGKVKQIWERIWQRLPESKDERTDPITETTHIAI